MSIRLLIIYLVNHSGYFKKIEFCKPAGIIILDNLLSGKQIYNEIILVIAFEPYKEKDIKLLKEVVSPVISSKYFIFTRPEPIQKYQQHNNPPTMVPILLRLIS